MTRHDWTVIADDLDERRIRRACNPQRTLLECVALGVGVLAILALACLAVWSVAP